MGREEDERRMAAALARASERKANDPAEQRRKAEFQQNLDAVRGTVAAAGANARAKQRRQPTRNDRKRAAAVAW